MELALERERNKSTIAVFSALQLLLVVTMIVSLIRRKLNYAGLCLASMAAVMAPSLAERLLHIRIRPGMKNAIMIYAVAGPVGGNVFQLYYIVPFWDKLLHVFCGVLFAAFGYCVPDLLEPEQEHTTTMRCVCAVAVAMCIGALWEIYEFCGDQFFGLDMQNDRVISGFSSYLLGDAGGELGAIQDITSVVVNGKELGVGGYIDIGLYDTMMDLVVCLAGALGVCVYVKARKREVQPMFVRVMPEEKPEMQ